MNTQNQSQIQQVSLDILGNGAYGVVKQVQISTHIDNNNVFAAKEVNRSNLKTQEDKQSIQRESEVFEAVSKLRKTLKNKGHCYLLCCYQIQSTNDVMGSKTTFLMQQAYLGDLQKILSAFQKLPPQFIKYLLAQLILALEQLHMLGYVHRDLKPGNIMLDRDGNLLLGDFGTARRISDAEMQVVYGRCSYTELIQSQQLQQNQQAIHQQGGDNIIRGIDSQMEQQLSEELLKQYKTMSFVGTINYIAPEALKLGVAAIQNQNQALINQLCVPLDVWAFGCIAYELATGHKFIESDESQGNAKTQRTNHIRRIEDRDLQNLILKCLKTDPLQRFTGTWAGFKKSKYFTGIDFDSIHETPLLNVLQTQILLHKFKLTGNKLLQQLPLLDPVERVMYQKYKSHLLEHEIIMVGLEQISVTLDSKNYRDTTLLITDNARLILLNNKTDVIQFSTYITPWNISLNCNVYSSDQRSKEVFEPQWEPVRQHKREILQNISQIDYNVKYDNETTQLSSKTSTKVTGQNTTLKSHNVQNHQNDNINPLVSVSQKIVTFTKEHRNSIVNDGQLYQAQPITIAIECTKEQSNEHKIVYLYVKLNEQAKTSTNNGTLQYFKFFSHILKNFTQNRCYGYTLCNNCKKHGLLDDICVACGIQNPQIQKQHGSLIVLPTYFSKTINKKMDLAGKYQAEQESSGCQLSSYLLRKNRLFVSREEFQWIYDNIDQLRDITPLPNVFQLAHQAIQSDLSTKPMLSGLTSKQHRLRKLLIKTYLFRKQQNVGDDVRVLPRILALFGNDITRHSEELLVLIERTYRACVGTRLNLYLMETHRHSCRYSQLHHSDSGVLTSRSTERQAHEFVNVIALRPRKQEIDF